MTYTRDIDHCPGNGCPLRESCRRYLLGQMAEAKGQKYTWWVSEEYDSETNACNNMLMIKDKLTIEWTEITEDNMDEVYNMDGNRLVIASEFLNEKIYRRYGEVSTTISTMVKIGGYYYMELPELNTNEQNKLTMESKGFAPVAMAEEYWANSHMSIARYYGGVTFNGHEYQIVNKHGITIFELSDPSSKHYVGGGNKKAIEPGEPADLVRKDFITYYRRLGRDRFLEVLKLHQQTSDTELKKIYKELTKKKK